MIKVLVADDECLARQAITIPLGRRPDVGVVYEAASGIRALELAEAHSPDVVFLDIQMPGLSGIEIASRLQGKAAIVFVTAYQEFAVSAFELGVADYLLKPVSEIRLYGALDKALKTYPPGNAYWPQQPRHGAESQSGGSMAYKTRLVIKEPGRIRLVDVNDISYIVGAGNYAEVHLLDGSAILHRETMTSLEHQLDPVVFVRIHRSSIVRCGHIAELRPTNNGDYAVLLKQGQALTLSRRNKHKLAFLLGDH
ncbi:DNA-binding response regulator [Alteromonas aestuariivivens]|uniref:DNA-binding response regulator n=1 Tax=Alteromonas aestuariivivens TaxID=1938339 RepID=A0A3D8MEB2_9ALTE|nr:LytTR family DNA-binding domain-containing protein [Alteromonas aestuariivivens]RDV28956.1 DNA-binding response regulator [Alteromonas aestuariivivens]